MNRVGLRTLIAFVLVASSLLVAGVAFGQDDGREPGTDPGPAAETPAPAAPAATDSDQDNGDALQDIGHLEPVYINGELCVGIDCFDGIAYGFTTQLLRENNLRIRAEDTSNTASFATRDWQLEFNSSDNGGLSYFMVRDCGDTSTGDPDCGGTSPFTIEAGAGNNALYVDDAGQLGLGTATPVADVHTRTGNTPTLRLDQDGTSGFTPQIWDIAGNEAGFFVRDATNGSTLPLRIRPGAPTSAIDVAAGGNVGIGSTSPQADLHVSDDTPEIRIEDADNNRNWEMRVRAGMFQVRNFTGNATPFQVEYGAGNQSLVVDTTSRVGLGTGAPATELEISVADDTPAMRLSDTGATPQKWDVRLDLQGRMVLNDPNSTGTEFYLDSAGNLTIGGALTELSDRNAKSGFAPVEAMLVLEKVAELPISTWSYNADADSIRHMGPTAQDFYEAFGLGSTNKGVSTLDMVGVAISAIQGMHQQILNQQATIAQLQAENSDLESRLAALEAIVAELVDEG